MSNYAWQQARKQALALIAMITPLDSRFQGKNTTEIEEVAAMWAQMIADAGVEDHWLADAVKVVYAAPERPLNVIGALLANAKNLRRGAQRYQPQLPLANKAAGPVRAAYEAHGALHATCPRCDAEPEQPCSTFDTITGETRYRWAPHVERMLAAQHTATKAAA